jgi:hypothetical protein
VRWQRVANARRRAAVELLDAPARRVAGLVVEIEIGEHVGGDGSLDAGQRDFGPNRACAEHGARERAAVVPSRA